MKIKRLFFLYNAFQFFFSLLIWVPIYYEYQKISGLSNEEIFRIQSFYYLIFCFLEIPTGYLADWLGYRFCLILGSATLVAANILIPFAPTYVGFFIHFMMVALARSFVSGAASAYLYESLHQEHALGEYKEAEGRARAYSLIGKVVCWAMVGPMMHWHLTLPYWTTALSAAIGLGVAIALPSITVTTQRSRASLGEIFSILIANPYLVLIMFQGVALFVLARICQADLFQPILESKGFPVVTYGMVMALMTVFEAFGAFKSKWVSRYVSDLNAIFIFTFLIGVSFFLLSYNLFFGIDPKVIAVPALCLFSYVIGISFPIQRQLINQAIPEPALRASLLSTESIIDRGVNSLVATQLGFVVQSGQLLGFLRKSALISIFSVFFIAVLIRMVRRPQYET